MSLQGQLRKAVKAGLVSERKFDDLFIYTYTPECQMQGTWNEITRMARGLILDEQGRIVARPMDKFFNLFERPETEPKNLPYGPRITEEKLDGSLGIVFNHRGKWNIATKGSLHSAQADYAREYLLPQYNFLDIDPAFTVLTEIIYPENKIVVNYQGFAGLKLLTLRNRNTGEEIPSGRVPIVAKQMNMSARRVFHTDILQLLTGPSMSDTSKKQDVFEPNSEGYVIKWDTGFRVKIKSPWYVRVHRALDSKTHKRIIDLVEGREYRAAIEGLPKDIQKEFDDIYSEIRTELWRLEFASVAWMENSKIAPLVAEARREKAKRKDFALALHLNVDQELWPIMFAMLDGKDYRPTLFKILRKKF